MFKLLTRLQLLVEYWKDVHSHVNIPHDKQQH